MPDEDNHFGGSLEIENDDVACNPRLVYGWIKMSF